MKLALRVAGSLVLAAALLVPLALWGGVSADDLRATAARLSVETYLSALGLHVALYVLRAIRFHALFPPESKPSAGPFLAVCAAHTLAAFVLPAKIGEATFVLYANRVTRTPASAAVASLVVSRLLDMAVLALGFGIACITLHLWGGYRGIGWFVPVGVALVLVSAGVFVLSSRGDLVVELGAWIARRFRLQHTRAGAKLFEKTAALGVSLREAGADGRLVRAVLVSIPIWLVIFLFCAVLARGLGLSSATTLAEATFGASLAIVTSLIPISAFANFGTLEMGWTLGFGVLGVPRDLAVATGLGLHVVQLANVVALGVLGHVGMALAARRAR